MIEKAKKWLSEQACPLWLDQGLDLVQGGFYENLSLQGKPLPSSRRVMVQARQVFSAHAAMSLGCISDDLGRAAIQHGLDFILKYYSLRSGAFLHAVDENLQPLNKPSDLYGQAFVLFALAHAYEVLGDEAYKIRALALLDYLARERRLPEGGYSEYGEGSKPLLEANPHMHLFEALLYWAEIDRDVTWRSHADELLHLCLDRLIDPVTGALAEHFENNWIPQRQGERFIFEPGHHYEWAWLLGRYQKIMGPATTPVQLVACRNRLYDLAESHGINVEKGAAFDEMWSDMTPRKRTARFWPQTERIKAALQMGLEKPGDSRFAQAADQAMQTLFLFLDVPHQGLWYDTWLESGEFTTLPAKASSFYHIIGAMADYIRLRESL